MVYCPFQETQKQKNSKLTILSEQKKYQAILKKIQYQNTTANKIHYLTPKHFRIQITPRKRAVTKIQAFILKFNQKEAHKKEEIEVKKPPLKGGSILFSLPLSWFLLRLS
jgi:hypothetical protein